MNNLPQPPPHEEGRAGRSWNLNMEIKKQPINAAGVKFIAEENGKPVGRAFLYILKNDLHEAPFGFLEDVFVEEQFRKAGIGRKLVEAVIAEAKNQGCYKLICTARHEKSEVHAYYLKFGFKDHGVEFRMDF